MNNRAAICILLPMAAVLAGKGPVMTREFPAEPEIARNDPHIKRGTGLWNARALVPARLLGVWATEPACFERVGSCLVGEGSGQLTAFTAGIFHVPLMMEGLLVFAQYMRSMRMNLPLGAGSQFDSFATPGL